MNSIDTIALGGDQDDVHLVGLFVLVENGEVEVHVVDVEWDVLLSLPDDRFAQLLLVHARHGHAPDDDGVAGDRCGDPRPLDLVVRQEIADNLSDIAGAHYGTLHDGLARSSATPKCVNW